MVIVAILREVERGLPRTDEGELEYYEKERLLLSAVRVIPGYLEVRRVLVDSCGDIASGG
jgi:hypothetical protein